MSWMEADPVSERVRFISAWLSREESVSALAIRFGVSRKTAYKWIGRYAAEGPAGLAEWTSAPVTQAAQTPLKIAAAILKLRRKHPAWGPRKLRARLQLDDPATSWPAASTMGDILKRAGLVRPRKLRRRVPPAQHPFRGAEAPNDVWCIDFKGFWRTGDGVRVLPFTVTDAMSRFLLVYIKGKHKLIRVRPANGAATLPKTVTQLPGLKRHLRDRLHTATSPCRGGFIVSTNP